MARPSALPSQVFDHVPDTAPALDHLPASLPPVETGPTIAASPTDVSPAQHALDAVAEHVPTLGVSHLPDFFGLG